MIIGLPKEIKKNENRVAATPSLVADYVRHGHNVYVETGAGIGSGFTDDEYRAAGAVVTNKYELYEKCGILTKVKEIESSEYDMLRKGQIVLTYLHSNAHRDMTEELLKRQIIGLAWEDVDDVNGEFPLLIPASILAGKGGFIAALNYSQSIFGGRGILLSRIAGVNTPRVAIIGCGYTGMGAAEMAAAFGNRVTMLDINLKAMERAKDALPVNVEFLFSNRENIVSCVKESDIIINCVLWDKRRKDHLISREDLKMMKPGAIVIDIACDEGGAIETCHSTSHDDPVYYEEGIIHYCVDNIPSAFSRTASITFSEAIKPYVIAIAGKGFEQALKDDKYLRRGLTYYYGKLTLKETADKLGIDYFDPLEAITN